jgi:uncharacterized membrane protein
MTKTPTVTASKIVEERVRRVELLISTILRVGVIASLVTIVIGIVVSFVGHPEYLTSHDEMLRLASTSAQFPHTISDVISAISSGSGSGIMMLGVLILIATPVVRVFVSIFTFFHQRDYVFTLITTFVLITLIVSFFLGNVER